MESGCYCWWATAPLQEWLPSTPHHLGLFLPHAVASRSGWTRIGNLISFSFGCYILGSLLTIDPPQSRWLPSSTKFDLPDDRTELIAAAKIFVERCAAVGAQLNDPEKSVEQRVTENDDFSGENYDYKAIYA